MSHVLHMGESGDNSTSPMMCHYITGSTLSLDITSYVKINKKLHKQNVNKQIKKAQY
jgi:hypothetical protein